MMMVMDWLPGISTCGYPFLKACRFMILFLSISIHPHADSCQIPCKISTKNNPITNFIYVLNVYSHLLFVEFFN